MKKILLTILAAITLSPLTASATPVTVPSATAPGDILYGLSSGRYTRLPIGSNGTCLGVSASLPAYITCATGGGGGVGTSTNPFMATYFVATSTTDTSIFAGNFQVNGSTFYVDALNNKVGIGTTTPNDKLSIVGFGTGFPKVINAYNSGENAEIGLYGLSATYRGFQANGTIASSTKTNSGDTLLAIGGHGYGNTGYSASSKSAILMKATEGWTDASQGANMSFETTANGGTTRTQRMVIEQNGRVGVATTAPSGLFAVDAPAATIPFYIGSTTIPLFIINSDGQVAIGMPPVKSSSSGNFGLSVQNRIYAGNGISFPLGAGIITGLSGGQVITLQSGGTGSGNIDFTTNSGTSRNFTFIGNPGGSGGNVGISTSTPYAKLSVAGNVVASTTVGIVHVANGSAPVMIVATSTGTATSTVFVIDNLGETGIGTSSPWRPLSVQGGVAMQGLTSSTSGNAVCILANFEVVNSGASTCVTSSARFKKDIVDLKSGLSTVMQLRPREFTRKQTSPSQPSGKEIGFIAEEVEKVEPRLVEYEPDGKTPRGVNYLETTAILTKAIQEQQKQIEELRKEIKLLKIKK